MGFSLTGALEFWKRLTLDFLKKGPKIKPAKNPPKCANQATPGEPGSDIIALTT